eukprot:2362665-Ditylum_brightwellii.AAC.1
MGQGAKDILNGNFDPNKSKNLPVVNYWLKHHTMRVAAESAINDKDKSTSPSPSAGHYYSHYKAILHEDN